MREAFQRIPKRNLVDLSKDADPIDDVVEDIPPPGDEEGEIRSEPPSRGSAEAWELWGCRWKPPSAAPMDPPSEVGPAAELGLDLQEDDIQPGASGASASGAGLELGDESEADRKREAELPSEEAPPGKRSRVELPMFTFKPWQNRELGKKLASTTSWARMPSAFDVPFLRR